jgi:hypothetical protein
MHRVPLRKGLFTAAMHYFALDRRPATAVDFSRTPPPGSASSNLVCELVLQMPPGVKPYEAQEQDMLGISISATDPGGGGERELVYAPQVIQMGEVMLAAEQSKAGGCTADNVLANVFGKKILAK